MSTATSRLNYLTVSYQSSRPMRKSKKQKQAIRSLVIPEEVITYSILPRLPFKSLRRFTAVCKYWDMLISRGGDPLFAKRWLGCNIMSRGNIIPDAATAYLGGIQLLPAMVTGSADIPPPLPFHGNNVKVYKIEASTDGVLCLRCRYVGRERYFLFLYNPTTKQRSHHVSLPYEFDSHSSVGLALTPSTSSETVERCSYILVLPLEYGEVFRYKVFSSRYRSQRWVTSNQVSERKENCIWRAQKSVSTSRCLYWYCTTQLICFHYREDKPLREAGHVGMPPLGSWPLGCWKGEIGVYEDMVTLTQLSVAGLSVWMLRDNMHGNKKYWEQIYRVSLERIIASNNHLFSKFLHGRRWESEKDTADYLIKQYEVWPLSYEGGSKVFFKMMPLGCISTALLSFDMNTWKVIEVFRGELLWNDQISYTKRLTPLPS